METVKPTRNILVAVDVQHDFIDGSLAVAEGEQVVAPLNTIAETDAAGIPLKRSTGEIGDAIAETVRGCEGSPEADEG